MIFSKDGNEISSCYLCGSNNSRDLYKNNNLVKCNNCGFVFYKYLPDKKTIDDIYSGNYINGSALGEGKKDKVMQWMELNGFHDFKNTTFYSDSINDLPLLMEVEKPVAVNPDNQLREIALKNNWQIEDLL